jgi:hypothetical protein
MNYHLKPSRPPIDRLTHADRLRQTATRTEFALHVREYLPANWHTPQGVDRKRRKIESRGLPNFHKWRFVTLTVARKQFPNGSYAMTRQDLQFPDLTDCDPCQMFFKGRDRMRAFLERLRVLGIIARDCPWCWKLEFQADGYPHWHLLLGRKSKFSGREMKAISKAWGLGRVNNEMIHSKGSTFHYTFKYAFKAVLQHYELDEHAPDEPETNNVALPDWFLDFVGVRFITIQNQDGSLSRVAKPLTLKRTRFWQTCANFYLKAIDRKTTERKAQETSQVVYTVRQYIAIQSRLVRITARNAFARYQISKTVPVTGSLEKFWTCIARDSILGGSIGLAPWSFVVPITLLKRITSCIHTITALSMQNLMTLRLAGLLQARRETLQTC